MIQDILEKLFTEGVGKINKTLFEGELPLPKAAVNCLAVIYSPSPQPHKTFEVYEQHLDFWSRDVSSVDAYSRLKAAQSVFHQKYAYELEHYFVYFSNSMGMIDDMDRDNERRKLYKLTMRFIYREKSES